MNGCRFLTSRQVIGWELPQCRCCCFWPIKLAPFGRGLSRLLVDVTSFWRADFLWRISRDARRHHKRHLQSLLSRDRHRVSGCAAHPIISPNEGSTFWGVNVPRIYGHLRHIQCVAISQIACPAPTPISKFSSSRKEGREAVRKPVAGREDWGCCCGSIRSIAQPCHSYGGDVNASIGRHFLVRTAWVFLAKNDACDLVAASRTGLQRQIKRVAELDPSKISFKQSGFNKMQKLLRNYCGNASQLRDGFF